MGTKTLLFLGISAIVFTNVEGDSKAADPHSMETGFIFKLFEISPQNKEDPRIRYPRRPLSSLTRLFHWFQNPLRYQRRKRGPLFYRTPGFIISSLQTRDPGKKNSFLPQSLEFIIKEILCRQSNESRREPCPHQLQTIVKKGSAYLSDEDPLEYAVNCDAVPDEVQFQNPDEQPGDVAGGTTSGWGSSEETGSGSSEKEPWENRAVLSRCLGCIFNMINK